MKKPSPCLRLLKPLVFTNHRKRQTVFESVVLCTSLTFNGDFPGSMVKKVRCFGNANPPILIQVHIGIGKRDTREPKACWVLPRFHGRF